MKKYLYALVIFFSSFHAVNAQQTKWIGPSTGSWSDAANWDAGVPGPSSDIIFDGASPALTGNAIAITDVLQSNASGSFNSLTVTNNALVTLSSASPTYFYFQNSIAIDAGSILNIGAGTTTLFVFGGAVATSTIDISGTVDLQGSGLGFAARTAFEPVNGFTLNPVANIKGTIVLSGVSAQVNNSNTSNLNFQNGSALNITRDGGIVPRANYQNGSLIKIAGVTANATQLAGGIFDGVINWDSPLQTVAGTSLMPSIIDAAYVDSVVVNNTGSGSIRLTTNPAGHYIKNVIVNDGKFEFSSPTGSSAYSEKVDTLIQNGGFIYGNAFSSNFDAFSPDTLVIAGKFIQNGGEFDFSNRTPANANPEASFVMLLHGDLKIAGTVRLSQPAAAPNCELAFVGSGYQSFEQTGLFINKIKTVVNSTAIFTGINLVSNVILPDSLVFRTGYLFLNDFDLENPLPVQPVSNPFQTHAVTNGAGFFVQKNVGTSPVGIPIGASSGTVNPLVLGFFSGSLDIAAKVEVGVNPPTVYPDLAVDRTWQIKPIGFFLPSNLAISFGYSDLTPLPGDGNVNFSYSVNNEVGIYVGGSWQVITLPGGIAPAGTNPYAITHVIPSSLLLPDVATPIVVSNVSGVVPVANVIHLSANKSANASLLKWDITETNGATKYFEVERSSDSKDFSLLATVAAQTVQLNYAYTDNNIQSGINYYRIKMYDAAGRFTYSPIVAVVNKTTGSVLTALFPNVVHHQATLSLSSAEKTAIQIIITDMLGRTVKRINASTAEGSSQLTIDCSSLSKGTYQLTGFANRSQTNILRFVKD
jgi:hypothetical protein